MKNICIPNPTLYKITYVDFNGKRTDRTISPIFQTATQITAYCYLIHGIRTFKKENIEIDVQDNAVVITGEAGWKYDKKEHEYLCKERACKTFYRTVDLPEDIKVDEVTANLTEGVLEITLPKKAPKQKRKVKVA